MLTYHYPELPWKLPRACAVGGQLLLLRRKLSKKTITTVKKTNGTDGGQTHCAIERCDVLFEKVCPAEAYLKVMSLKHIPALNFKALTHATLPIATWMIVAGDIHTIFWKLRPSAVALQHHFPEALWRICITGKTASHANNGNRFYLITTPYSFHDEERKRVCFWVDMIRLRICFYAIIVI
jgi:hypothetical protein